MKAVPDYINEVCRIGQGHACCRYLTVGADGFDCEKRTAIKVVLDARGDSMTARGDNCPGMTGAELRCKP
jgi:hypothetical protein